VPWVAAQYGEQRRKDVSLTTGFLNTPPAQLELVTVIAKVDDASKRSEMNGLVNMVMRRWNGDVLLEALAESERSLLCQSGVSPGSFYTLD
jgi:hypothetical protein